MMKSDAVNSPRASPHDGDAEKSGLGTLPPIHLSLNHIRLEPSLSSTNPLIYSAPECRVPADHYTGEFRGALPPRAPRKCSTQGFLVSSIASRDPATYHGSHQYPAFNPAHNITDMSIFPSPISKLCLFVARNIRKFLIPKDYQLDRDGELWARFPDAMRAATGVEVPPNNCLYYLWNTERTATSHDEITRDPRYQIRGFRAYPLTDPIFTTACDFLERYHRQYIPKYDVADNPILRALFPNIIAQQTGLEIPSSETPIIESPTLRECANIMREREYDAICAVTADAADISQNQVIRFNKDSLDPNFIPAGTTFAAKKSASITKIALKSIRLVNIDALLVALEMFVRTRPIPANFDAVKCRYLWIKHGKAMPAITRLPKAPPNLVNHMWE
ncbi:hypothetical protein HD806DRAFT_52 [Xylariaceae sp. AK1471]|nr:hypothetical protein HD806DRAFT_52 [Xylariaceae sp. AK1471]